METKPLLYGLIGFFIGGLIVSVAATQLPNKSSGEMSMSQMTKELENKSGDDYDKAFIAYMIEHHQAAVDMAKLSADRAKHDEVKQLSTDILGTQSKEINLMQTWQTDWGYNDTSQSHQGMNH
jgi:uncharacterized protein (DUF305 family)